MKTVVFSFVVLAGLTFINLQAFSQKIFDVHLHGSKDPSSQVLTLQKAGVYKAAISSSWDLQDSYRNKFDTRLLFGLMLPCPNGKVPYSLQPCYDTGKDWPSVEWVEEQIKNGKIDYFGELLNQYYGISPADSLLFPYYRLAQKYNLPVGIHTGGAGPDHGCANFKMEMGSPLLLRALLSQFPKLRIWIMHSGVWEYKETITLMQENKEVYADLSVISNPDIVPLAEFSNMMKAFISAGLEDRLMFGTDNGDIEKVIASIESLSFLSEQQKKKLYYQNAEHFFGSGKRD